jgi:hypothetical protein
MHAKLPPELHNMIYDILIAITSGTKPVDNVMGLYRYPLDKQRRLVYPIMPEHVADEYKAVLYKALTFEARLYCLPKLLEESVSVGGEKVKDVIRNIRLEIHDSGHFVYDTRVKRLPLNCVRMEAFAALEQIKCSACLHLDVAIDIASRPPDFNATHGFLSRIEPFVAKMLHRGATIQFTVRHSHFSFTESPLEHDYYGLVTYSLSPNESLTWVKDSEDRWRDDLNILRDRWFTWFLKEGSTGQQKSSTIWL